MTAQNNLNGQDEPNPLSWLATWAGKMVLCSGLPAVSCKKNSPETNTVNPLLFKLVWSRWLDTGVVLFFFFACFWTWTSSWSINAQKGTQEFTIQSSWHHNWSITHNVLKSGCFLLSLIFRKPLFNRMDVWTVFWCVGITGE